MKKLSVKKIKKSSNKIKKSYLKKVRKIKKNTSKRYKKFKKSKSLQRSLLSLIGRLPGKKDIVVFESFFGKQYSCNPRAVYEYLKEQDPKRTYYWSVDHRYKAKFEEHNVNMLPRFTLKWFMVMMRAKYWVFNSRLPKWIPKPEKTVYLQTWHGTPLKKLALDMEEVLMPGTTTETYKKNFVNEASRWDYLISPNRYSTDIFRRAFSYDKNLLETGYPRNDYLVHHKEEDVQRVKRRLGIPADKKVVLYAPTWRDNEYHFIGRYKFSLKMDLDQMQKELGDEYVVLLRLHYLVSDQVDVTEYEGFAYDASNYEDIRDLYIISDILMTDYSSVLFDYGVLKRPMIFFVYDIESYRDQLRGFYFDFEKEAPGPLVRTTDEIIKEIRQADTIMERYKREFEIFENNYNVLEDGNASKRVVERVFLK